MAFDRGGELVGLSTDLATQLGSTLGRSVRFVRLDWRDLIPALGNGEIDVIASGMTITRAREFQVAFADPYLRTGLAALVRPGDATRYATPAAIMAMTGAIGVIDGTTGEVFVRERCPDSDVEIYPRLWDAVQELGQRRVDVVVAGAHLLSWFAAQNEGRVAGMWTRMTTEDLAWGFRPEDDALRTEANAALARWKADGSLDRIVQRWLPGWRGG
jgi:ABC-type amino acid transport substrate-binding protein